MINSIEPCTLGKFVQCTCTCSTVIWPKFKSYFQNNHDKLWKNKLWFCSKLSFRLFDKFFMIKCFLTPTTCLCFSFAYRAGRKPGQHSRAYFLVSEVHMVGCIWSFELQCSSWADSEVRRSNGLLYWKWLFDGTRGYIWGSNPRCSLLYYDCGWKWDWHHQWCTV